MPLVLRNTKGAPLTWVEADNNFIYLDGLIAGKANTIHSHVIADVTNLQLTLDSKAPLSHTHTISQVTGLQSALDSKQASLGYTPINVTEKGAASGVAPLGADTKVPASFLPSYVDDVIEVANFAALPVTGETGKIYVTIDNNKSYRWSGTVYVEISASPGSTDAVPEGATNLYFTQARVRSTLLTGLVVAGSVIAPTDTVLAAMGSLQNQLNGKAPTSHTHAMADITGLSSAFASKQDTLVSGINIKTINGESLLGPGNIIISGGGGSGSPGGGDKAIQFNDLGVLSGSASLTWDKVTSKLSVDGDITISGVGRRIRGDFSNGVQSNRVGFQTSVLDSGTFLDVIPNGVNVTAGYNAISSSDALNCSTASLTMIGTDARISSGIRGSGTYLPMTFYTSGAERLRIDTAGNIIISTLGARIQGDFSTSVPFANRVMFQSNVANGATVVTAMPNGTSQSSGFDAYNSSDPASASRFRLFILATEARISSEITSGGTYLPIGFYIANTQRLSIETNGNIIIPTLGARIMADFGGATIANRVMFQSSILNTASNVEAIPNGTSQTSSLALSSSSTDPANCSYAGLLMVGGLEARLHSGVRGSGTYLPLVFHTSGAEHMRIGADGNTRFSSPGTAALDILPNVGVTYIYGTAAVYVGSTTANVVGLVTNNTTRMSIDGNGLVGIGAAPSAATRVQIVATAGMTAMVANGVAGQIIVDYQGTGGSYFDGAAINFRTLGGSATRLLIDANGILVRTAIGLGYGTGAGGTVAQATSKATSVTLNKPCGIITTTADALAAGAVVGFQLLNSFIALGDSIIVNSSGSSTYQVWASNATAGACSIRIRNYSAGSLSDAIQISFSIIKGSST